MTGPSVAQRRSQPGQPRSNARPALPRGARPTAKAPKLARIASLDGLRVLAACGVILYHVLGAVLGTNPTAGVILPPVAFLFFVLSGFVIFRPFVAADLTGTAEPNLIAYYRSRLLRVMPLWWFAVAVYLAVNGTSTLGGPREWLLTLGLLQTLDSSIRYSVIGPAWALSVEWIFYLSVPIYSVFASQLRRALAPGRSGVAFHLLFLIPVAVAASLIQPLRPMVAILVGMAFAIADVEGHIRSGPRPFLLILGSPWVALVVTVGAWIGLASYPYKPGLSVQWVEQDARLLAVWVLVAMFWFAAVAFGTTDGSLRRWLAKPWLVAAANLTFGLYIWHALILDKIVEHLGRDANVAAAIYLTFLGSFAVAFITWLVIEKPLMSLRKSPLLPQRITKPTAATPPTRK